MNKHEGIHPEVQSGSRTSVTVPRTEAAFIHACKGNYGRDPRYGVLKVYRHLYSKEQKKPYVFILQILIGIIYRYRMIENEDHFQWFMSEAVFGKWYSSVWERKNETELHRALRACITVIQLWQVRGRSDHYDFDIGKADLFSKEDV